MKLSAKSLFRIVIVLLVLCYAAAHVLVRTDFGRRQVLHCLSDASGLSISADKARLSAGLSLKLANVVAKAGDGDNAVTVFSAPALRISKRCRGIRAKASGAELRAIRASDGSWLPAAFASAENAVPGIAVFPAVSPAFGKLFVALDGARVVIERDGAETEFSDLEWIRRPAFLAGHPGAVQNRISYGAGPALQDVSAGTLPEGCRANDEWFELHEGIVRFVGGGYVTGPTIFGRISSTPAQPAEDAVAPENPEAPGAPEAPEAPEPPAQALAAPENPEVPEAPEAPAPVSQEAPETPEVPEAPEVPENPEALAAPEAPEAPAPVSPEAPAPASPEAPEAENA